MKSACRGSVGALSLDTESHMSMCFTLSMPKSPLCLPSCCPWSHRSCWQVKLSWQIHQLHRGRPGRSGAKGTGRPQGRSLVTGMQEHGHQPNLGHIGCGLPQGHSEPPEISRYFFSCAWSLGKTELCLSHPTWSSPGETRTALY